MVLTLLECLLQECTVIYSFFFLSRIYRCPSADLEQQRESERGERERYIYLRVQRRLPLHSLFRNCQCRFSHSHPCLNYLHIRLIRREKSVIRFESKEIIYVWLAKPRILNLDGSIIIRGGHKFFKGKLTGQNQKLCLSYQKFISHNYKSAQKKACVMSLCNSVVKVYFYFDKIG